VEPLKVTLPDSSVLEAENGSTLYEIIGKIGAGLQQAAVAASVDGEPKDLVFVPQQNFSLIVHTFKDPKGKEIYWHSTSHLMAQAVKRLYPSAKVAIGPAIDAGFYYDFELPESFSGEDLEKIEAEMAKIRDEKIPVVRNEMSKADTLAMFEAQGEIYKTELISEIQDANVTVYRQGDFADFCRGPHVKNTGDIKEFKLMKIAGAYWRGSEKNRMLTRIYGISFPDKKQLKEHLSLLEEAKERDHRKIGAELGLFETCNEVGPGLVLWTPKGARIRVAVEEFWRHEHYKNGYDIVYTPHIGRSLLWETSGHLVSYKDGMYSPMDIDGENYYVKPMNCPFHIMIYKSKMRSYREFPIRWAEMGTVYRYEKSGTLHGLLRVRGFTQDDAHIFCRLDQISESIVETFHFSLFMLKSFGFENFQIYLSTRPTEGSVGSDELWHTAIEALRSSLDSVGAQYKVKEGDGAFYGPKIDIAVKDAIGREWQLSTLQLDFNLPQRFELTYKGKDGEDHQPIMIHRALLGSLERFFGILIEHYKGAFPVWLSPVQAVVINVSDDEDPAARALVSKLMAEGLRAEVDIRNETMGYKVRDAVMSKIPYVCVIGKKEAESNMVSVRRRGEQNGTPIKVDEFVKELKATSDSHKMI